MVFMRIVLFALTPIVLVCFTFSVEARNLSESERYVCGWGSGIAGSAQSSKLAGVSRYAARKQLQTRRFPQQWMKVMALGITEQTYDSRSRLKPKAIKKIYYDDCIRHELARR